jgi:nitroreductase
MAAACDYGMTRPAEDDHSARARNNRAAYELHDRAGEFTSASFVQKRFPRASELLLGGSIFPAMQHFLLAARARGLGACITSWASPTTGCSRATSWWGDRRAGTGRCAAAHLPRR